MGHILTKDVKSPAQPIFYYADYLTNYGDDFILFPGIFFKFFFCFVLLHLKLL